MAKRKINEAVPYAEHQDAKPSSINAVTADSMLHSHPSPALQLQSVLQTNLQAQHQAKQLDDKKYPFVWTIAAMSATSAAFWTAIVFLFAHH